MILSLAMLLILAVASGAQMNFFPKLPEFPADFPFGPGGFPTIKMPTPWYQGQNVCKEERVNPDSDEMNEFLGDFGGDSSSSSESCQGDDDVYICRSRQCNFFSKLIMRKMEISVARMRRRKRLPGELSTDCGLSVQQKMSLVMVAGCSDQPFENGNSR